MGHTAPAGRAGHGMKKRIANMDRLELEPEILARLAAREGDVWQEVQGEQQDGFEEFAVWILLYEDSDPKESHAAFVGIVTPFMEAIAPTQFTVSYSILTDTMDIYVDGVMDNDEILSALDDPRFGKRLISSARKPRTPFVSAVSTKRPVPMMR